MPKNRITATLGIALAVPLWALAQDPAAPAPRGAAAAAEPEAPPTAAEATIDAAIDKLKEIKSASASLKVAADMLNQKIRLEGEYKKAPGYRVYMLLSLLGTGDASDRMLQVCDGKTLWNFTTLLNNVSCTRQSLDPLLKVLNGPNSDAQTRNEVLDGLGFAGPDTLLSGLRKAFLFDQTREEDLDGKAVWVLGGSWKDTRTPVMPGGQPTPFPGILPPYVPTLVTVYLDKQTGWPYKVLMEGRIPAQIEQRKKLAEVAANDGASKLAPKPKAPSAVRPSKLTLTYSDVQIGGAIPDETFAFSPPANARTVDVTDQFVSRLEAGLAQAADRKKQQAEKAGPILEGGAVPAPSPEAEAPAKPADAPKR